MPLRRDDQREERRHHNTEPDDGNGKIQTISRHHRKRGDRRHSLSLIEIKPKDAGYAANRR